MEARATLALADDMIQQIETIVVYKDPSHFSHGVEAVGHVLDQLTKLPPQNVYNLLLISNGAGWSYANMFAVLDDQDVLAKYIALLNWLYIKEISSEKIFNCLNFKDLKEGQIFSRKADVKNKQAYLDLLCQLTQKDGVKLSDVHALLETPNKRKTTFFHDILTGLISTKNKTLRPQYCALLCCMIDNQLISDKSLQLFVSCREIVARYILNIPAIEAKQLMLERILKTNSRLGQFFLHPPTSHRWLAEFQMELGKIKPPGLQEEKIEIQTADQEQVELVESDPAGTRSHKKTWFGFFRRESSDEAMELQTIKVFSPGLNGQSKLD